MNVGICIPIYNDWTSAGLLLAQLEIVARSVEHRVDVVFIDDGSCEAAPVSFGSESGALARVSVLRLRRNLGHQRAIAIGLTHMYVTATHDILIVMDGDGEDRPEDVPRLIDSCVETGCSCVVFAQRTKRSEGLVFRIGYAAFKALHLLLVGRGVEVGNFSAVPRAVLAQLVSVSELWNHYAAAVHQARLLIRLVPTTRARRLAGESKMNFVALVLHGLSAISVYSDIVGVRMLRFIFLAMVAVLAGIAAVVGVKLGTDIAIPGWATNAAGMLLVSLLNLTLISILLALFTLRSRTEYSFLPLRDHTHFVLEERVVFERER